MERLNKEAAANLNLGNEEIARSNLVSKNDEFAEELSDGGERNNFINKQSKKRNK